MATPARSTRVSIAPVHTRFRPMAHRVRPLAEARERANRASASRFRLGKAINSVSRPGSARPGRSGVRSLRAGYFGRPCEPPRVKRPSESSRPSSGWAMELGERPVPLGPPGIAGFHWCNNTPGIQAPDLPGKSSSPDDCNVRGPRPTRTVGEPAAQLHPVVWVDRMYSRTYF